MKHSLIILVIAISFTPVAASAASSCSSHLQSPAASGEDIYIHEKVGAVEEHSIRKGNIAAHIYMDSEDQPYAFIAFPEGNSGVGLWFKSDKARLQAVSKAKVIREADGLHGAEVDIKAGVKNLEVDDSVLGSMRFLRDRELEVSIPTVVQTRNIQVLNRALVFHRRSLNGLFEYILRIMPTGDTKLVKNGNHYRLISKGEVRFRLQGLTSERPLTPISPKDVFKPAMLKRASHEKLQAFSFLLYKEKLMAGSPRYFTKFGRDSIYTLRVLMEAMKPEAIESLLDATISSMHPEKGLVSHEQNEGDFASFERLKEGKAVTGVNEPIEDYKMVDDDFAFVIVLGEYMRMYPERFGSFLKGKDRRGILREALVSRLFDYIMDSTRSFADQPVPENLIALQDGEPTGQWRDSVNGLGGGRYPFDVNAAFVPGALRALVEIYGSEKSGFRDFELERKARRYFSVWNTKVLPLFEVRISAREASLIGQDYLRTLGIDPNQVSLPQEDLVFPAIALDEEGLPIPIMHSDDSLMMTFGSPTESYLRTVSQRINYHFPYGLSTSVGILVANPVFTSEDMREKFDETKYHGRVSWTMQEDLLVYGIRRQLEREDLSPDLRSSLIRSKEKVEKVIQSKSEMGGTEVFSIFYRQGRWMAVPFSGDAKSNSNQLWSHLRLFPW